MQPALSKSWKV